ncbi:MAG TPA: hypothetical protein VLD84_02115 [Nitrososphaeraceae archaeon]|nr:hypothetical protein [Nitrososphaeraceae archaeon]
MTGAKLQTIDRYEVGQKMGLDKTQTDNMVNQLSDINMIKKVMDSKIILNLETKIVLDDNNKILS